MNNMLSEYNIDYIEIFSPMAKVLAYWHQQALGFSIVAYAETEPGKPVKNSYLLTCNNIRLVLTSAYSTLNRVADNEVASFISANYCGVKRVALQVDSVQSAFEKSVAQGGIPVRFPATSKDEFGYVDEAAIKLLDDREIVFVNRKTYHGVFKPGYKIMQTGKSKPGQLFQSVDHIASEVRINEGKYWTNYLSTVMEMELFQSIEKSKENETGMVLNICQSPDRGLTFVIAEPESYLKKSKVQMNIDNFGPGIHHLAFTTNDLVLATKELAERGVEFVSFPPSYYNLLRNNPEFQNIDIDALEENGILIDKEADTYLLQKFIKPINDRPFFFYEIVQRINGYNGFALKNINVLKKAEELEIMRAEKQ
jgi:4-hydroxyphenylpyruvate dioxygenase